MKNYVNMYEAKNVYRDIDSLCRYMSWQTNNIWDRMGEEEDDLSFDSCELMIDSLRMETYHEIDRIVDRYARSGRSGNFGYEVLMRIS